jgi:PAS domain S-box-containing protein
LNSGVPWGRSNAARIAADFGNVFSADPNRRVKPQATLLTFFQRIEEVWDYSITFLVVIQAVWITFLLIEHSRRTRLEAETQKTAAALRETESRNRAMLDAFPDMMFLQDEQGTYLDWHANDRRYLYAPPEKFLGKTMKEILPPDICELFTPVLEQVLSTGKPARVEYSLKIDGEPRFFETRIVLCPDRKLLSVARDITDMKRTEIELQQLSSQLVSLQDDERRRISRELHDTTAQHLFAITINIENLKRMDAGITRAGIELLNECRDLCERSLQEVRTLSYLSHPPELERTGLISALRWYVEGFRKRTGIAVDFQVATGMARLPNEMEVDIFRVVQEGLFNVFRHSGSHSASIFLKGDEGHLVLQIKDSGHGLQGGSSRDRKEPQAGVGLSSMRERLRRWGGNLKIESSRDGAMLVAEVPLPSPVRAAAAGS